MISGDREEILCEVERIENAEMICAALNAGEEELAKAILTADRAGKIWEPVEVH